MQRGSKRRYDKDVAVSLVVFVVALGVYLRTMARTVYNLDSAELATGAYTLGIVHPPGYPTYLLLGKLFTLLPIGDVGYRLNLMSGFFGALTVTGVYLICRQLACSRTASMTAALLLAFSHFFWAECVVAEVYTLHACFLAGMVLVLLVWRERRRVELLLAFAFLYGLSYGAHTSSILLAPGFAAFILLNRDHEDSLVLATARMFACSLAGLSAFAYLPIRYIGGAPNLTGWFDAVGKYHTIDVSTLEGLRWFVSGELFRSLMFAYDTAGLSGEATLYLRWLWGTFAGVGIVLGVVGLIEWLRTRPRDALAIGLLFTGPLLFFLDYAAIDKETMFLATYVVWSLWIGAGGEALLQELGAFTKAPFRQAILAQSLVHCFLLAMPVLALCLNYRYTDVSWDRRSRDWATEILEEAGPNAVVLGWWSDVQPMVYLQLVEGVRPDVLVLSRMAIGPAELDRFLGSRIGTTPVYSADLDPSLYAHYDFQAQRRGYRLLPKSP